MSNCRARGRAWGLLGNPNVSDLSAAITPATDVNQAFCQVDFTDVSLAGPRYGYPDATHCGGAGMAEALLFGALTNWAEAGVEPDHLVARVNPTRTRKVCTYPSTPRFVGSGSTDDEANFVCDVRLEDDPDLLLEDAELLIGDGPLSYDFDIGKARLMNRNGWQ